MNRYLVFIMIAGLLAGSSCRKPSGEAPQSFTGCRIKQMSSYGLDTSAKYVTAFYYNNDGSLHRIYSAQTNVYSGWNRYLVYGHGFINVRNFELNNTTPTAVDSLTIDDQDRVTGIYHIEYNRHISRWDEYLYDANGQVSMRRHHDNTSVSVDTFAWQDGDLVRYAEEASFWGHRTFLNTYSPELLNTGNFFMNNTGEIDGNFSDFVSYGRCLFHSRHLLSKAWLPSAPDTAIYTYTTDTGGRLTSVYMLHTGYSYNSTTNITYECR